MREILILLLFFTFNKLISQEIVSINDIYLDENNIAYRTDNDQKFTGFAQKTRKNGHVVYEDQFNSGIIVAHFVYFKAKDKKLAGKLIYNKDKPFVFEKFIEYKSNRHGNWQEIKYYDQDGLKTVEEIISEEKTTYRCEFLNGKKHGTEFCRNKDGTEFKVEYKNGKKIK